MDRAEAERIYDLGKEAVISKLIGLSSEVELLKQIIVSLEDRIQKLENMLSKDSHNSSKPPSSDGLKKPKLKTVSLRKKSGKKSGGQKGHKGHTLKQSDNSDHVVPLKVISCPCCADLSNEPVIGYEKRQVFDLPEPELEVTEYQGEIKNCPKCGQLVKASFPEAVNTPVQYGERFRAILVYMQNQHFIPSNRLSQMMNDLYSAPVSEATIYDASKRIFEKLAPFESSVVDALNDSTVLHVDESGVRAVNKLHWLHSASTDSLTFYGVHEKRGNEAMDHFNILPNFKGRLIHDFWKPYLSYDCDHGLCNAHHLRELTFLFEQQKQNWAKKMFDLLMDMNNYVTEQHNQLTPEQKEPWLEKYLKILSEGWQENPLPKKPPKKKKRGRIPKTKSQNLLIRLGNYESWVLAFLHDINVPFTNNLGEQDIRMIKVRLKISGCFRTLVGAERFARIRSYLSSARKQERNILNSITDAIRGKPFMPATS